MEKTIKLTIGKEVIEVPHGILLMEVADRYKDRFKSMIVLAVVNNKLSELNKKLREDATIRFIDLTDKDGYRIYQRSLSFILVKAAHDVLGSCNELKIVIHYSINRGFYCEVNPKACLDDETVQKIKARMMELIHINAPIKKSTIKMDTALKIFKKQGMDDKTRLYKYTSMSNANIYELEGYHDYFYGYMAPSTGGMIPFDLFKYDEGLVLQFMDETDPTKVSPFKPDKNLFKKLKESSRWGQLMKVVNIGDMNDVISKGKLSDLLLVSEALMEKSIAEVADCIMESSGKKRFVFIAGPSSSGKTTFANRLSVQLRSHGINPMLISLDNYFVDRDMTPRDEDGKFDFESINAIDINQLNKDMKALLEGEKVELPLFDFISGERKPSGKALQFGDNDLLVIEGIHGLNPTLSHAIPESSKFKIYISTLTQLNIDDHNRIPTTDARLIRRIVRDNQYRGADAQATISMWPSVRRGEERNIFPYQENADIFFNSALIYELAVLKQFAEPLLYNVPEESEEYLEAKRLIKFLSYFLGSSSEFVPHNSLLREFIGGSCFSQ